MQAIINALLSRTTQNVLVGGTISVASIVGLLVSLRAFVELPWPPDGDEKIAYCLAIVVTPILSRLIAFARTPEKKLRMLVHLLIAPCAMLSGGFLTASHPALWC